MNTNTIYLGLVGMILLPGQVHDLDRNAEGESYADIRKGRERQFDFSYSRNSLGPDRGQDAKTIAFI